MIEVEEKKIKITKGNKIADNTMLLLKFFFLVSIRII